MKVPSKEKLFDIVRPQLNVIEARAKALEPPAPNHADILANKIVAELHLYLSRESNICNTNVKFEKGGE